MLTIWNNGDLHVPVLLHSTIGQDRPVGGSHTFREHQHNLYHIVLYTAGHGACLLNGHLHRAEPGTVIIVSPGQPHDFVSQFGTSVYSELTFTFENHNRQPLMLPFDRLLGHWAGTRIELCNPIRLSTTETHQVNTLLTEITDLAGVEHSLSEFHLRYAMQKLFYFILQSSIRTAASVSIADERLLRVRHYIEQRYDTPIRIEELAMLANLSKGYLFRAFKKTFGVSPQAYQKQLRLEAAKTLLRSSALRCSEIAERCGYDNNHFFHRIFKNTFGITPTQYRKCATPRNISFTE